MLIPLRYIIFFYWFLAASLVIIAVPIIVRGAWKGSTSDAIDWRRAKVLSSALGFVGFILLALNFEQTVRSSLTEESRRYIQTLYLDAKFAVTYDRAIACSKSPQEEQITHACSDFTVLDTTLLMTQASNGTFDQIKPWRPGIVTAGTIMREGDIGTTVAFVNNHLAQMEASHRGFELTPLIGFEARFWIAILSLMLVLLALCAGLGESVYQLKQAIEQEKQRRVSST
jgi:hypothetical protein